MRLDHALNHPDSKVRQDAEVFRKAYREGRYTQAMIFDRVKRPWERTKAFQFYWKAKEFVKMHLRVTYRKFFPVK